MFAPKLYTVRKFTFTEIISHNFNWDMSMEEEKQYYINQQDNMLFRQIRLITGNKEKFNPYVIFMSCKGAKSKENELAKLVRDGFILNGRHFVLSERSASMTRNFILSFVDEEIAEELNKRITMDIKFEKTVLSKYYAYRGLMFSSCHCIENWYPKVIVVPDYFTTIPNQKIKYVYDKTSSFKNSDGEDIEWVQKDIAETVKDIDINAFDGAGICHPKITDYIQQGLGSRTRPSSWIARFPFCKG